jgi:hypothetical protein
MAWFDVKSVRRSAAGVTSTCRFDGAGRLMISANEVSLFATKANTPRAMLASIGIGLLLGFLIVSAKGVNATPGTDAWLLMFVGEIGMVTGVVVMIGGGLLMRATRKDFRLSADPRIHPAAYDNADSSVAIYFADGSTAIVRLRGKEGTVERLLWELRACYGKNLQTR